MSQFITEEITEVLSGHLPAVTQSIRTQQMLSGYAGEAVRVERITGFLFVYGSELGVLRIFARYNKNGTRHNPKVRVGYSREHKTWLLVIEVGQSTTASLEENKS